MDLFFYANRNSSSNFNATVLKFSEKFDHPFLHVIIFGNMFPENHGFVDVLVTRSTDFVSLHQLYRAKLEHVYSIQLVSGIANKP